MMHRQTSNTLQQLYMYLLTNVDKDSFPFPLFFIGKENSYLFDDNTTTCVMFRCCLYLKHQLPSVSCLKTKANQRKKNTIDTVASKKKKKERERERERERASATLRHFVAVFTVQYLHFSWLRGFAFFSCGWWYHVLPGLWMTTAKKKKKKEKKKNMMMMMMVVPNAVRCWWWITLGATDRTTAPFRCVVLPYRFSLLLLLFTTIISSVTATIASCAA